MERASDEVFAVAEETSLEAKREKGRETIEDAIFIYLQRQGKTRRGHVEFIRSALKRLKDYDVHQDLSVYKSLFEIFPEGKMIPKSVWQSEFMHFPKQQDCGMEILIQMERNGVIPDDEFGRMILRTFGMESMVMTRYQRMMYWMPKMRHVNPWPVPRWLPTDPRVLTKLAVERLSVDRTTEVTQHETKLIPGVAIDTFITSAQSRDQRELLARHDKSRPVYVEGPITSWFREKQMTHFVLRADPDESYWRRWEEHQKYLEETKFKAETFEWFNFIERREVHPFPRPTIHQQEDGDVYALAFFGEESMDAARAWLRVLTIDNPALQRLNVVFRLNFGPEAAPEAIGDLPGAVGSLPAE